VSDYGDPEKKEADFKTVLGYSPVHNVPSAAVIYKDGKAVNTKDWNDGAWKDTSVLLLTGDHDDRVVPLHSFKMISALQFAASGGRSASEKTPISKYWSEGTGDKGVYMTRLETRAGHGAGKSLQQRIEEAADKFAFAAKVCGFEYRD
jgi:prolyl oligopeptidase